MCQLLLRGVVRLVVLVSQEQCALASSFFSRSGFLPHLMNAGPNPVFFTEARDPPRILLELDRSYTVVIVAEWVYGPVWSARHSSICEVLMLPDQST